MKLLNARRGGREQRARGPKLLSKLLPSKGKAAAARKNRPVSVRPSSVFCFAALPTEKNSCSCYKACEYAEDALGSRSPKAS